MLKNYFGTMSAETDLCAESETRKVEIEENNDLNSSDRENVGEVCNDSVCDNEEKSEGADEGTYVIVGEGDMVSDSIFQKKLEPEGTLLKEEPILESNEEKEVEVVESDNSCKVETDCSQQYVTVEGSDENTLGATEWEHVNDDDDERSREKKLDTSLNIDSVQSELHQDKLDSKVEIGNDQDSQSLCVESMKDNNLENAGEAVKKRKSEVVVAENLELKQSEDDVFGEDPSLPQTKEEGVELEMEMDVGLVHNTQIEVEATDCIYESGDCNVSSRESSDLTDEEAKDSSYVFVDGADVACDDPVEKESVIEDITNVRTRKQEEESQGLLHIVVGTVVCGLHPFASSTEISPSCSDDSAKSETRMGNHSVDKAECLPTSAVNNVLTETDAINDSSEFESNDSVGPLGEVYLESEVRTGSTLSNRENTPSSTSSSADTSDEKVVEEMEKPIFRYLIKSPRYIDDSVGEQIKLAELRVDEMTQRRDVIRGEVKSKKATCNEYRDKFEAAKVQVGAAYDALHVNRQKMDSVQSALNKIKNVVSIDDIHDRISSMEHRIEHETIPLKEEKQLIREIKQLKLHRQQLCTVLGRQSEMLPDVSQREELEQQLKHLKKDMDTAKKEILRTEGITDAARKLYLDENEKLRDMQAQFRSANVLRQEAYTDVQRLKKQLYEKNKYFRMYKDDASKAKDYGFSGNRESLHFHCVNQVENFMELWNKNADFRKEYLRCNTESTFRRLGTLEGLSRRPDKDLPKVADYKVVVSAASAERNLVSPVSTLQQGKSVLPSGLEKAEVNSVVKQERKLEYQTAQSKETIPFVSKNSSATVPGTVEVEEKTEEENAQAHEGNELAKKEELLKKEAASAKTREQRLLEERVKAKEAEERKRRNAEKAQFRAELTARKEAELREKERAKRERRKARKKATAGIDEKESSVPSSEDVLPELGSQEADIEEKAKTISTKPLKTVTAEQQSKTVSKRPQKSSALAKQAKTKVVPPPFRNKNKKRMQPWMWVLLAALVVFAAVIFHMVL